MGDIWLDHVSFSQLTTAEQCPYSWFLSKVAGIKSAENAFAQAGTLAHQLLAAWANKEVTPRELPTLWVDQYLKAVTAPFPPFLKAKKYDVKLFDSILTYFEHFDGFPGFDVVGVEKEFSSSLGGERFEGIIDLILRDQTTGGLMLVDHKSCSLASFKKTREMKYRQLLLYSKYCADEFGTFPERLRFNLFKENTYDERRFDPKDYMAARGWAERQVTAMKARELPDWFETRPEMFRCTCLCNCRHECMFGDLENHKKEKENDRKPTAAAA